MDPGWAYKGYFLLHYKFEVFQKSDVHFLSSCMRTPRTLAYTLFCTHVHQVPKAIQKKNFSKSHRYLNEPPVNCGLNNDLPVPLHRQQVDLSHISPTAYLLNFKQEDVIQGKIMAITLDIYREFSKCDV